MAFCQTSGIQGVVTVAHSGAHRCKEAVPVRLPLGCMFVVGDQHCWGYAAGQFHAEVPGPPQPCITTIVKPICWCLPVRAGTS